MKIEITLSGSKYGIYVDTNCYTPYKVIINSDENSANIGKETEKDLGYFTSLPNAIKRLIREQIASRDEVVSLKEFASLIKQLNDEITAQLEVLNV